ncbi:MAG: heavy metal translocating P-type ATPase [Sandaracinaceae bacterium]
MSDARTIELDLGLLLPSVASDADPCIERLRATLDGREGVTRVHITQEDGTGRLCVHFDPDRLSVAQVESLAEAAGLELERRYVHVDLDVEGLTNERRARLVGERLRALPGVLHARASASAARVHVELEPEADPAAVDAALERLGLRRVQEEQDHDAEGPHEHAHGGVFGDKSELVFSLLGGALTLGGWIVETTLPDVTPWLARGVLWAAYFFGGYYAVREVFEALRAKRLEIDFLMLVAAAGAGALGEWVEGALLLFLFSLGHALEGYAMGRARRAISALSDLAPKTATVLKDGGGEEKVPVEDLAVGDRVLVRPNSRVPADGFVVDGSSAVNQAPITGESIPVDKSPVDDVDAALEDPSRVGDASRVFAGTINGASALEAVVTKAASDSTLARVVTMVREAQTQQSPTQQFTDRFERVFVPSVLVLVVLCLFAWVVIDEPFSASFYRAMAVLVAASPCALAIATPSAVLSGVARAARGGVLIKGGAHLETLGVATIIAFDKTGTLTRGEPRLVDVRVAEGVDRAELARVTVAVERESDHPLARAMVEGFSEELDEPAPEAVAVEAITGFGVRADVDGAEVFLGKPDLFRERLSRSLPADIAAAIEELADAGRTTVVVAVGERFLGVLGLMDPPRDEAKATLARLHELGVKRTLMLTGDHQRAADGVAALVGLDEARGDLLPEDKVAAVRELAREGTVAMVGDGVNDAPAMAQASVGIAMGASGSDVALETADVALMADDLATLPFAVSLSRASRRVIRQNLWASLGMVAFLIPATLFGVAGIGWAVLLHEGSTLLVVANALRLLAHGGSSRPAAR